MKRFLAILLASLMVFALFGCQNKETTDNKDAVGETQGSNTTTTEDTTPGESVPEETVPVTNGLGEAELSLYNPNAPEDTSLVTIVGYVPFREGRGVGTSELISDAAVLVVDFEEAIKNKMYYDPWQYIVLEELAFVYQLGLGNDKYSVANIKTTNDFGEVMAKCFTLKAPPEKLKEMCVGFVVDQYNCIGGKNSKDFQAESCLYGDNWYAYKSSSGKTDKVNINFKETDKSIYYLSLNLDEQVDINIDAISQKVNNKEFRDSVIFLSDIDDLSSTTLTYGKEVDLKNTVFYQDAVATQISNLCGLNLRNKDYFYGIDNTYIIWDLYDSDGYRVKVTYNAIGRPYKHSKYENYYNSTENRIERVIGDDTYVYINYNEDKNVHVFKNGECTGYFTVEAANPTSRTTYENLNMLFGFKPTK